MLQTVLFARDKWLKEGGILLPDKASIYLSAVEDQDYKNDKINWWNNVYGFNMSVIRKTAAMEPLIDGIEARKVSYVE